MSKQTPLNEELIRYFNTRRFDIGDELLAALQAETTAMGDVARLQISPTQGAFLSLLTSLTGARTAVEIGTFTGYSALCIARALPADGQLHCFDRSREFTTIARSYWERAGLQERITLHLGDADEQLATFLKNPINPIDLAFIDAEKARYDRWYETLLPHVRPGGVIVFDNMFLGGKVADLQYADATTRAVRVLNDKLTTDERVDAVLLPIADGLQVCRKK